MKSLRCGKSYRLLAAVTLLVSARALAVTSVWDGGALPGNTGWGTIANWTGNVLPPNTNDVEFGSGFTSGTTIQTAGSRTVNSLVINTLTGITIAGGPTDVITLTSGAITREDPLGDEANHIIKTGIALGANATWSVWGSGTLQIDGPITGVGRSLTKYGWGLLLLTNGSGNYSGGTFLEESTTQMNGVWNGTGIINIALGAGLDVSGATISNPINLRGDGEENWGALRGLTSSTISGPITLMANSTITAKAEVLTISGAIGDGTNSFALTKAGAGELRLTAANVYKGGTTITDGTLSVLNDSALGSGPVTITAGKLLYTANTATLRNFSLNFGRLQAAAGVGVALSNSHLTGGFIAGPGTFTSSNTSFIGATSLPGSSLQAVGATSLTSFTNSGALSSSAAVTWDGGVNTSSGIVTLSSNILNTTAFSNDGVITINNTASLVNTGNTLTSGGGSRITLNPGGTLNVSSNALNLNGALLVNNGTISGLTNVNFGSVAKGAGLYGAVNVTDGGKFSPGNSPGSVTTGSTTWKSGGSYVVEIADALNSNQRDMWEVDGQLTIDALLRPFVISLTSLDGLFFDNTRDYTWPILHAHEGLVGFDPSEIALDTANFKNNLGGGHFTLESTPSNIIIHFSSVPEPLSSGLMALGLSASLRRRKK